MLLNSVRFSATTKKRVTARSWTGQLATWEGISTAEVVCHRAASLGRLQHALVGTVWQMKRFFIVHWHASS